MTICSGSPICGAARPTPGASDSVSRMCSMRSRMRWLRISSGVKGLASPRNSGSPTLAMLILISFPFSQRRRIGFATRPFPLHQERTSVSPFFSGIVGRPINEERCRCCRPGSAGIDDTLYSCVLADLPARCAETASSAVRTPVGRSSKEDRQKSNGQEETRASLNAPPRPAGRRRTCTRRRAHQIKKT